MFCPVCRSEYRDGFVKCSDCEIELVSSLPAPVEEPGVELVKVFETGEASLIPVVKSLLDDAGIDFSTRGEPIQDLFGWGRFGTGLNYVVGPVEFLVREEEASDAAELLSHMADPLAPESDESENGV